jgi:hypothetical protein
MVFTDKCAITTAFHVTAEHNKAERAQYIKSRPHVKNVKSKKSLFIRCKQTFGMGGPLYYDNDNELLIM